MQQCRCRIILAINRGSSSPNWRNYTFRHQRHLETLTNVAGTKNRQLPHVVYCKIYQMSLVTKCRVTHQILGQCLIHDIPPILDNYGSWKLFLYSYNLTRSQKNSYKNVLQEVPTNLQDSFQDSGQDFLRRSLQDLIRSHKINKLLSPGSFYESEPQPHLTIELASLSIQLFAHSTVLDCPPSKHRPRKLVDQSGPKQPKSA